MSLFDPPVVQERPLVHVLAGRVDPHRDGDPPTLTTACGASGPPYVPVTRPGGLRTSCWPLWATCPECCS